MPNVTAIPRQMSNGEYVTAFNDTVGTTSVTYTYSDQHECLNVTNKGTANQTLTVNGTSYTIQPGQNQQVNTGFTSFSIVSASQVQPFEARAANLDTDSLKGHVQVGGHRWSYNTDEGLRRWRAALAKVKAGTNQVINVSVVGDSITEGNSAGVGPSDYLTKGYVGRLRQTLAVKYGDVGTGIIPVYFPNGAPLWAFSGWTDYTGYFGCAGFSKQSTVNGNTATLTFNGTGIGIVFPKRFDAGTFTVSIDGGVATSYDAYSSSEIYASIIEITGLTQGDHTCVITSTVAIGKKIWLHGAYPIKGTAGVRVNMVGRSGTLASHSSTTPAMPSEIDIWNPALTIIALTANDYTAGTPLSTYRQNLQSLVSRAKTFGDCLLVSTGIRTETGIIPQIEYTKAQKELAAQNGVAFIDIFNRWGGDANYVSNTLGFLNGSVHPNDYGHQDIASAILRVIDEY